MADQNTRPDKKELVTLAEANRYVAEKRIGEQDWSGMPLPVPGLDLVVEPRYRRKDITEFRWKECYDEDGTKHAIEEPPPSPPSEWKWVNSWWNARYQLNVVLVQNAQGRAEVRFMFEDRLEFTLRTLQAAAVWPVEAERKAQQKLATLVSQEQIDLYELTGHFTEVSKRSDLTYLFRKGRPTVVMKECGETFKLLCALCLHPIGYYGDTWAGVMCPTDEVIAHLLMMRGSEEKYWANANQHPLDRAGAGV